MGRLARLLLVGLVLVVGCGGPEFTLAVDGGELDVTTIDAASPSDGNATDAAAPPDSTSPEKDGGIASDAESGRDAGDGGGGGSDAGDAGTILSDGGFACPSSDPTVVFCSDFDKTTSPPWEWAGAPTTKNGTVAVDTTDFLSPPNGFEASNAAFVGAVGTDTLAYVEQPFTSVDGRIDYSFHAYVKTYDTINSPSLPVAQLIVGPQTSGALIIQLVLKKGELELVQLYTGSDGGAAQTTPVDAGPIATQEWGELELLLDRRATIWTITVFIDGVSKLVAQAAATPSNQNLEADLGLLGVLPPSTANAITFDNVTVRAY